MYIGTMLKSLFMYVNTDYAVFEVVHFYLCQSIVITEMLIGLFLMYVFCLSSIPFFKANAKKNRLFVNYIIKTATWAGIYLNLCMFLTFDFGLTFHLIFLISFVPFYEMKFTLSNNNKVSEFTSFEINSISLNSSSLSEKLFPSDFIDEIFLIKYNISKKSFKKIFGSIP